MTAQQVDNLRDLTDSACINPEIRKYSERIGHVPIAANPRSPERKQKMQAEAAARTAIGFMLPDKRRLEEYTAVECGNSRINP